jgi:hypothetical protein
MRFTVVWDPTAERDLTNFWLQAPDQQAIADAADEIDRLLRLFPLRVGTPFGSDRILTVEPLEVVYTVSAADCLVTVLSVVLVP